MSADNLHPPQHHLKTHRQRPQKSYTIMVAGAAKGKTSLLRLFLDSADIPPLVLDDVSQPSSAASSLSTTDSNINIDNPASAQVGYNNASSSSSAARNDNEDGTFPPTTTSTSAFSTQTLKQLPKSATTITPKPTSAKRVWTGAMRAALRRARDAAKFVKSADSNRRTTSINSCTIEVYSPFASNDSTSTAAAGTTSATTTNDIQPQQNELQTHTEDTQRRIITASATTTSSPLSPSRTLDSPTPSLKVSASASECTITAPASTNAVPTSTSPSSSSSPSALPTHLVTTTSSTTNATIRSPPPHDTSNIIPNSTFTASASGASVPTTTTSTASVNTAITDRDTAMANVLTPAAAVLGSGSDIGPVVDAPTAAAAPEAAFPSSSGEPVLEEQSGGNNGSGSGDAHRRDWGEDQRPSQGERERVLLNLVDTPSLDVSCQRSFEETISPLLNFVGNKFEESLEDEQKALNGDHHVHLCLYLLDPDTIVPSSDDDSSEVNSPFGPGSPASSTMSTFPPLLSPTSSVLSLGDGSEREEGEGREGRVDMDMDLDRDHERAREEERMKTDDVVGEHVGPERREGSSSDRWEKKKNLDLDLGGIRGTLATTTKTPTTTTTTTGVIGSERERGEEERRTIGSGEGGKEEERSAEEEEEGGVGNNNNTRTNALSSENEHGTGNGNGNGNGHGKLVFEAAGSGPGPGVEVDEEGQGQDLDQEPGADSTKTSKKTSGTSVDLPVDQIDQLMDQDVVGHEDPEDRLMDAKKMKKKRDAEGERGKNGSRDVEPSRSASPGGSCSVTLEKGETDGDRDVVGGVGGVGMASGSGSKTNSPRLNNVLTSPSLPRSRTRTPVPGPEPMTGLSSGSKVNEEESASVSIPVDEGHSERDTTARPFTGSGETSPSPIPPTLPLQSQSQSQSQLLRSQSQSHSDAHQDSPLQARSTRPRPRPTTTQRQRPRAHLPALEITAIQALSALTNVLPVIARADVLGTKRLREVKDVVRRDLAAAGIGFGIFEGFDGAFGGEEGEEEGGVVGVCVGKRGECVEGEGSASGIETGVVGDEETKRGLTKKTDDGCENEDEGRSEVKMEVIEDGEEVVGDSVIASGSTPTEAKDVEMRDANDLVEDKSGLEVKDKKAQGGSKASARPPPIPCLPYAIMSPDVYFYDDDDDDDGVDEDAQESSEVLGEWIRVLEGCEPTPALSSRGIRNGVGSETEKSLVRWIEKLDGDGRGLMERYLPRLEVASMALLPSSEQGQSVQKGKEKEEVVIRKTKMRSKLVRRYRWGNVDVRNPVHCDFDPLRRAVFYHMETLRTYTREYLLEKYRADVAHAQLQAQQMQMLDDIPHHHSHSHHNHHQQQRHVYEDYPSTHIHRGMGLGLEIEDPTNGDHLRGGVSDMDMRMDLDMSMGVERRRSSRPRSLGLLHGEEGAAPSSVVVGSGSGKVYATPIPGSSIGTGSIVDVVIERPSSSASVLSGSMGYHQLQHRAHQHPHLHHPHHHREIDQSYNPSRRGRGGSQVREMMGSGLELDSEVELGSEGGSLGLGHGHGQGQGRFSDPEGRAIRPTNVSNGVRGKSLGVGEVGGSASDGGGGGGVRGGEDVLLLQQRPHSNLNLPHHHSHSPSIPESSLGAQVQSRTYQHERVHSHPHLHGHNANTDSNNNSGNNGFGHPSGSVGGSPSSLSSARARLLLSPSSTAGLVVTGSNTNRAAIPSAGVSGAAVTSISNTTTSALGGTTMSTSVKGMGSLSPLLNGSPSSRSTVTVTSATGIGSRVGAVGNSGHGDLEKNTGNARPISLEIPLARVSASPGDRVDLVERGARGQRDGFFMSSGPSGLPVVPPVNMNNNVINLGINPHMDHHHLHPHRHRPNSVVPGGHEGMELDGVVSSQLSGSGSVSAGAGMSTPPTAGGYGTASPHARGYAQHVSGSQHQLQEHQPHLHGQHHPSVPPSSYPSSQQYHHHQHHPHHAPSNSGVQQDDYYREVERDRQQQGGAGQQQQQQRFGGQRPRRVVRGEVYEYADERDGERERDIIVDVVGEDDEGGSRSRYENGVGGAGGLGIGARPGSASAVPSSVPLSTSVPGSSGPSMRGWRSRTRGDGVVEEEEEEEGGENGRYERFGRGERYDRESRERGARDMDREREMDREQQRERERRYERVDRAPGLSALSALSASAAQISERERGIQMQQRDSRRVWDRDMEYEHEERERGRREFVNGNGHGRAYSPPPTAGNVNTSGVTPHHNQQQHIVVPPSGRTRSTISPPPPPRSRASGSYNPNVHAPHLNHHSHSQQSYPEDYRHHHHQQQQQQQQQLLLQQLQPYPPEHESTSEYAFPNSTLPTLPLPPLGATSIASGPSSGVGGGDVIEREREARDREVRERERGGVYDAYRYPREVERGADGYPSNERKRDRERAERDWERDEHYMYPREHAYQEYERDRERERDKERERGAALMMMMREGDGERGRRGGYANNNNGGGREFDYERERERSRDRYDESVRERGLRERGERYEYPGGSSTRERERDVEVDIANGRRPGTSHSISGGREQGRNGMGVYGGGLSAQHAGREYDRERQRPLSSGIGAAGSPGLAAPPPPSSSVSSSSMMMASMGSGNVAGPISPRGSGGAGLYSGHSSLQPSPYGLGAGYTPSSSASSAAQPLPISLLPPHAPAPGMRQQLQHQHSHQQQIPLTPSSAGAMGGGMLTSTPISATASNGGGSGVPLSAGTGLTTPLSGTIPSAPGSGGIDNKSGGRGRALTGSSMHHMQHRHHGSGFGRISDADMGGEDIEYERERVGGMRGGGRGEGYDTRSRERERERWEAERRGEIERGGMERNKEREPFGGRMPMPPNVTSGPSSSAGVVGASVLQQHPSVGGAAQSLINLGTPAEEDVVDVLRPKNKKITVACSFCRSRKLKCDGGRPSCSQCLKRAHSCDYKAPRRRGGPARGSAAHEARYGAAGALAPNLPGGAVPTPNVSPPESSGMTGPAKAGIKRPDPDQDGDVDGDVEGEYEGSGGEEASRAGPAQQHNINHPPPPPAQRHNHVLRNHQQGPGEGLNGYGPGRYGPPLPTTVPPPPSAQTRSSSGIKVEGTTGNGSNGSNGNLAISRRNSNIELLIAETLQSPRAVPREREQEQQRMYANGSGANGNGSSSQHLSYTGRGQQQAQQQQQQQPGSLSFSGPAGSPSASTGPGAPGPSSAGPQVGPGGGEGSISAPVAESSSAGGRRRTTAARGSRISSNYGPKIVACNFCRARKTKCDGQRPTCQSCARRSLPCSYVPDVPPGTGRGKRGAAAAAATTAANATGNGKNSSNAGPSSAVPSPGVNGSQHQPQVQPQLTVEPPGQATQQYVNPDTNANSVEQHEGVYASGSTSRSVSGSPSGAGASGSGSGPGSRGSAGNTRGAKRSLPGASGDDGRGQHGKRVRVDRDERDDEQAPARLVDVRAGA